MKRIGYLLIFLTFWAQFDDVLLLPASASQSVPLSSDDDEYVPSGGQQQQEWFGPRQKPQSVSAKPEIEEYSFLRRRGLPEWKLTTPCAVSPLHLFMSLQI
jgi:hypothetical protein